MREKVIEEEKKSYGVLHGVSGDDVGVVVQEIGGEAIGEEADADVPLHEEIAAVFVSPNPTHPHPILPVPVLELEILYFPRHAWLWVGFTESKKASKE